MRQRSEFENQILKMLYGDEENARKYLKRRIRRGGELSAVEREARRLLMRQQLTFARAVAADDRARLYNGHGEYTPPDEAQLTCWMSLFEAVGSRRPYYVTLQPDVLNVDVSVPTGPGRLQPLIDRLEAHGLRPVLMTSGRGSEFDVARLMCRIVDPGLFREMRSYGANYRVRRTARPPLAPYYDGEISSLVKPSDYAEALAALRGGAGIPS